MKKEDFFLIIIVSLIALGSLYTLGFGAFYCWNEALSNSHDWWWYIFAILGSLIFFFFFGGVIMIVKEIITEARKK